MSLFGFLSVPKMATAETYIILDANYWLFGERLLKKVALTCARATNCVRIYTSLTKNVMARNGYNSVLNKLNFFK